jgi:hypothetical protein
MLSSREDLPEGLLEASPSELYRLLPGPSLIHLAGRRPAPLLVSVLLHGNESTGFLAVQALLQRYRSRELPRALSLFIGNVAAARLGQRRLDGQPDFNRIWRGGPGPEHAMAQAVLQDMRRRQVFASVDLHNNTGINPHYACVNRLDHRFLHLATLFSRTVVLFAQPDTVLSLAFAELCPSVTLECGLPGTPYGTDHALEFLEACLHLAEFPAHPVPPHDLDLFHTVATVKVSEGLSFGFGFGFGRADRDIRFLPDLDHLNFRELPSGTLLGWTDGAAQPALQVWDERGESVSERYFAMDNGEIRLAQPVMPAMLTRDEKVIRQDCFCYLMERLGHEHLPTTPEWRAA